MRKTVRNALFIATLPLAAGFAFSHAPLFANTAFAQSMPVMGTPAADPVLLRLSQMENQIRELTGQLEQREFQLRQLQESHERFVADTNARFQSLSAGTQPATPAQSFDSPAYDAPAPQPSAPASPSTPSSGNYDGAYTPQGTAGQLGQMDATPSGTPDTVTSGRPQSTNPAQAYDQAFGYLQAKNYSDAENAFQAFLRDHAGHSLAGNAQYWLGETYYAQTQYTSAARTFAKAFQDYPQGQKAPDALFKLALTLEKMNKTEDACLTMNELRKRFPTGPASILRRADEESARMQCSS